MNNTIHKKVSNAPPLVRGKPDFRKKLEVRSQKLEVGSRETEDRRLKTEVGRPKLKGKSYKAKDESQKSWILNLDSCVFVARGRLLLYLRDGPIAIRDPIGEADRERYIPVQTQNSSVRLCEISVISVVKNNRITMKIQNRTGQHRANNSLNNKGNPLILHGNKPHAGGEFLNSVMGLNLTGFVTKREKKETRRTNKAAVSDQRVAIGHQKEAISHQRAAAGKQREAIDHQRAAASQQRAAISSQKPVLCDLCA